MSTAMVTPNEAPPIAGAGLMPVMSVAQAASRYNLMVEFTKTVMYKDQDYGVIPGVSKPCLYKAGAEKLCSLFGLAPSFTLIERTEDWTGKDHNNEPFFYYFYKCQLVRGAEVMGEGDGSCNSWEKKYRYRKSERKCPKCGKPSIIVGKAEYGGGFICFAKKGGCGAKFGSQDASITSQSLDDVPNPDVAEQVNTIQKMAQKRALVAAVLIACNASAFYTQDVEDMHVINAEYEEVPLETQAEVLKRKLDKINEAKQQAPQYPPANPATIIELADQLDAVEQQAPIEMPKPKKAKGGTINFDGLKKIGEMKTALRELTGTDQQYYETLKVAGVDHANELSTADGREVWKALAKIHKKLSADKALRGEVEAYALKIGPNKFAEVMGANGFSDLDEFMANATAEQITIMIKDLKNAALVAGSGVPF